MPTNTSPAFSVPSDSFSSEQVKQIIAAFSGMDVLDTQAAADYLHVSRQHLELLRLKGGGPRFAKIARLVRYRRASLDQWLLDCEVGSTSEKTAT